MKPFTISYDRLIDLGLPARLVLLYGKLRFHCRDGKCKWWISSENLAKELGLHGKNKHRWVYYLLARLHELKLIDWRRGRNRISEYWVLPFPDLEWLAIQIRSRKSIQKPKKNKGLSDFDVGSNLHGDVGSKNKGLSDFDVGSNLHGDVGSNLHQNAEHAVLSTGCEAVEVVYKNIPSSPTPSPFAALQQTQNGRKNGAPKREPVPVYLTPLGRCHLCGARPINGCYCVCPGAIAAYEQRNHTNHKQEHS